MATRREGVLAALVGLLLALALGAGAYAWWSTRPERFLRLAMNDPEVRKLAFQRLVSETSGIHDSDADPDVGRILLAGVKDREIAGHPCSTNSLGLREDEFAWEKPPGTLRVVFLGDSFVFGWGAAAEDRMGVVFQRMLAADGIEAQCLHLGVVSWNFVAECAFVRRQLSELRPDLVVQIAITNDLEDCYGVRGVGVPAFFSPHVRERANGLVANRVRMDEWPKTFREIWKTMKRPGSPGIDWPIATPLDDPPLLQGLDWESRTRYDDAARRIGRLADLIEARGGHYLLLARWDDTTLDVLRKRIFEPVGLRRCAILPPELNDDPGFWSAPDDPHWNAKGHELAARIVHALVRTRGLLGERTLSAQEGEDELLATMDGRMEEAADPARAARRTGALRTTLSLDPPTPEDAAQVYAGLAEDGLVAPYASLILRNAGGPVVVEGEPLQREELRGTEARVFLDEVQVGTVDLSPGPAFRLSFPLPAELAGRSHLCVRFVAADYVDQDLPTTRCIAFRLRRVTSSGGG